MAEVYGGLDFDAINQMRADGNSFEAVAVSLGITIHKLEYWIDVARKDGWQDPCKQGLAGGVQGFREKEGGLSLEGRDHLATALERAGYPRFTVTTPSHDSIVRLKRQSTHDVYSGSSCALAFVPFSTGSRVKTGVKA